MIRPFSKPRKSALSNQVMWRHEQLLRAGIDQTRLAIADAPTQSRPFSFSVIGDTDAGLNSASEDTNFSQMFAQQLASRLGDSRFLLHTGDVTYPIGSFENYRKGFLKPYQTLLSQPVTQQYQALDIIFSQPFLPVPGNHDYANVSRLKRLRQTIRQFGLQLLGIDGGRRGGQGGKAYAQTFLDDLASVPEEKFSAYLSAHYSALNCSGSDQPTLTAAGLNTQMKYCLDYRPGQFTRLPNRYYRFRYSGIDFFALDSNTWNSAPDADGFDHEQLAWLEAGLIHSWQDPDSRGRIVYLHHSPYTTEVIRAHQRQTLWVRKHLRQVFDQVALTLALNDSMHAAEHDTQQASLPSKPAIVDLVISGHAHCLEHLQTTNTGHCDNRTDWLVCGGSGIDLRAQRCDEKQILESVSIQNRVQPKVVAHSRLYAGIHGQGKTKQKFHSFVRIDVTPDSSQLMTINPFVVTVSAENWQTRALAPINVGYVTVPTFRTAFAA